MKKLLFLFCLLSLVGCGHKKPELAPTQVVDGKSIIIPPDFDVLPKTKK